MRNVILYMSMSLDGFVGSDREHPGIAIPEGAELKQWKLDHISKAGAHLMGRTSYQEMSSYWPQSDDEYAAPPSDLPPTMRVRIYGGGALIFDEYGQLKYKIANLIEDSKRQTARLKFLWETDALESGQRAGLRFAQLHRKRMSKAE